MDRECRRAPLLNGMFRQDKLWATEKLISHQKYLQCLTFAALFLFIGLIANLASTAAQQQRPFAVAFAVIRRLVERLRIVYTNTLLLLNHCHFATCRRFVEVSEVSCYRRARNVIDFNSKNADAGALVPEGEVDAFLCHSDALGFDIDVNIRVVIETTFTCCDAPDELVALGLPRGWFTSNSVELVEEKTERLFTAESVARKQGAISYREMDFDVQAIGRTAINEW